MELKEGMGVYTPGGEQVGKVNRFVLDPATNELTHIVIQKGWLLPEDKVVPFEMVKSAVGESVVLSEEVGDFDKLPPFEETQFIRVMDDRPEDAIPAPDPRYEYTPAYFWYPAQSNIGFPGLALGHYAWPSGETKRNIPEDTVPLKEGTNIISSDGKHVGDVERLFLEGDSNKVTHFVISQGVLFKDRKLVPAHWVKSVEEDEVHLVVSSQLLERLPSYQEEGSSL
jgi:sporulation protein YlmC with PRC-barrel domain